MTFTITSVSPKLIAREVNPYQEEYDYCIKTDFTKGQHVAGASVQCFKIKKYWQEAEANLKEYELTKESIKYLHKTGIGRVSLLNQQIQGELILENGETKIKVV